MAKTMGCSCSRGGSAVYCECQDGRAETSKRIENEKRIVRAAAEGLHAAGYLVGVDYGDGGGEELPTHAAWSTLEADLFQADEEWLVAYRDGAAKGWVRLVYGNDGPDVICDYTTNLEAELQVANKLADELEAAGVR